MTGNLYIDLAISVVGIAVLVALARLMFANADIEISEQAAAERLAFDEPDFEPVGWLVDRKSNVALARNAGGEIAVIKAMGDGLVTRRLQIGDADATYNDGALAIGAADHTSRPAVLRVNKNEAQDWFDCLKIEAPS